MRKSSSVHRPDLIFLGLVLGLLGFGAVMVYDASIVSATRDFGDKFYFVKEQLKWIGIGLAALVVTSQINYRLYQRLALPILGVSFILLLLVFIPGIGFSAYGASRWIDLRLFSLQPAELMKLSLAVFLAAWFAEKRDLTSLTHGALPVLVLLAVLAGLLLKQPDLGTFIIIATMVLVVYFIAGARFVYYLAGIPILLGSILVLILTSSYRKDRLLTFLDPTTDPQGKGYHINQILLALGSGGLFGTGIGQSRGKFEYLPEVTTDSIFAVIGEELGFIGAVVLISVFAAVIYRGFRIAQAAPDHFGKLLAAGIVSYLAIQAVLNLAAMVALVPLTGVPLPFISYGGSNLVVTLASVGILVNVSKYRQSSL